jgi:hypothetical protein
MLARRGAPLLAPLGRLRPAAIGGLCASQRCALPPPPLLFARSSSTVSQRVQTATTFVRTYWPYLTAAAGGVIAIYGLGSAMYHVTGAVLDLDLKTAFEIGLVTGGVGAAITVAALAVASRRYLSISIGAVQRRALAELAKSPAALAALGPNIRASGLRAYNTQRPKFASSGGLKPTWIFPRARMLLQVRPRTCRIFPRRVEMGLAPVYTSLLCHQLAARHSPAVYHSAHLSIPTPPIRIP